MEPTSGQAKDVRPSGPGCVRERVLAEHERLRIVIAEVDRCATAVASGREELVEKLRREAENLYHMLARHIDHEDAVLAPLIRRIDAWGSVRFEQMQRDHKEQREALARALLDLETHDVGLGKVVQSMTSEILHDMKREEHDLLHPDLWREDLIVVEFGG